MITILCGIKSLIVWERKGIVSDQSYVLASLRRRVALRAEALGTS
jgi:hypothetical protein